jgi:DNA polymerase-3 subunit epsilon
MSHIVVLDTETTGFNYSKTDRVIEIAAVKYDKFFQEVDRFETLVNPMRDLGAQHIHGIDAAWVIDAPLFADVADELLAFMNGAVLVGHNIDFDLNFISAELSRAGRVVPDFAEHSIDTLRIARSIYGSGQSCKLTDLAVLFSLDHTNAHAALADVQVTAQVLQVLIANDLSTNALLSEALENPFVLDSQAIDISCVRATRPKLMTEVNSTFITSLVDALPLTSANGVSKLLYVDYLKRAILDGVISEGEAQDLMTIASDIGLSISDIADVHHEVFAGITAMAWSDGRLSDFERSMIDQVARQLGVGEIELEKAKSGKGYTNKSDRVLSVGDVVVLTGTMQPPKEQVAIRIVAYGAQVADTLTKKTNLLVAADPNTLSGKGQKARKMGIPIVSTSQLLDELEA